MGRFAGHGHEDARGTSWTTRSEEGRGVLGQGVAPLLEAHGRLGAKGHRLTDQDVQVVDDPLQRRDDVFLRPPHRREPDLGQRLLDLTQVEVAQGEVVDQVGGALTVPRVDALELGGELVVAVAHLGAQDLELPQQLAQSLELLGRISSLGHRSPPDLGRTQTDARRCHYLNPSTDG